MGPLNTPIVERYENGQVIISEGVLSSKAYVILTGKVRISKKKGNRMVSVAVLREGDTFGEMGLFQDAVRSATATAASADVSLGVIDRQQFKKMLQECPATMRYLINSMVNRLRLTTNSLVELGLQLERTRKSMDSTSVKDVIT